MLFWLELAYARWVVGSVRSMPLNRWGRLRLPSVRVELGLLGLWLVILLMVLSTSDGSGGEVLLVPLAIAFIVMAAWRFLGEHLSSAPPLRYMLVTGRSWSAVPRSDKQRAFAVREEWQRRVGSAATASLFALMRLNRRINTYGLAVGCVTVSLGTSFAVLRNDLSQNLYFLSAAMYVLGSVWSFVAMRRAFAAYRADLAALFGEPLPPGPPGDPARFEEWLRTVPSQVGGSDST